MDKRKIARRHDREEVDTATERDLLIASQQLEIAELEAENGRLRRRLAEAIRAFSRELGIR